MKRILILSISIILIGCSENRLMYDQLTNNGTKDIPIMYYEGELFNGVALSNYSSSKGGQLANENHYKDGKKDGLCKQYYQKSQLKWEGNYKAGVLGNRKSYFKNGKTEKEIEVISEVEYNEKIYYPNDQMRSEGNYKEGKGKWKLWKVHGILKTWQKDGKIKSEGNYINGKMDGVHKQWHNGELRRERIYKEDVMITNVYNYY